jgi:hypothetical protein
MIKLNGRRRALVFCIGVALAGLLSPLSAAAQTSFPIRSGIEPVDVSVNGGGSWQPANATGNGAWHGPVPGTQWVYCHPSSSNSCGLGSLATPKVTLYRTNFVLPAGYSAPSLGVQLFADNAAIVYVNGVEIGRHSCLVAPSTCAEFLNPSDFFSTSAPLNFHVGVNELSFAVSDFGGASGLSFSAKVSYTPAPPTFPPTFSLSFDTPAGSCICTPLLMNTDVNGKQTWWVNALGGPLTITAIAHAVNDTDPETVVARIFDASNALVDTLTASYPGGSPNGFEAPASTTIPGAAGVYRVEVTTPGALPSQPHYRLKFSGANAVGTHSPSSPSFEHHGAPFPNPPAPLRWYFNVAAGESPSIQVFAPNPPVSALDTLVFQYELRRPDGSLATAGSLPVTTSSPGFVAAPASGPAGHWTLDVINASHHYGLDKQSGLDRGIYLAWDSAGFGTLQAVAKDGDLPGNPLFMKHVEFVVYNDDNVEVARQATNTGTANFGNLKLPAGVYTVHLTQVALGWTGVPLPPPVVVTVMILCDKTAEAAFVVKDLTPPVIGPILDQTLEATGPDGAAASWPAAATDLGRGPVPVSCAPPSGSTFSLGMTTVTCNAVDLAGNPAAPVSFTVNVVDTTPPAGACTPSYNPSTKNIPRASRQNEDGFYLVSSSDIVTASPTITIGAYTLRQGETVKFTQSPGTNGVVFVNNQGREPIRHFRVGPGDPVITITDEAGNTTTRTCYVPPLPK